MTGGGISIGSFYESLDAAEELFSEHMQNAMKKENSENITRYKGALDAVQWLKKDLCYDILVPMLKRKGMM